MLRYPNHHLCSQQVVIFLLGEGLASMTPALTSQDGRCWRSGWLWQFLRRQQWSLLHQLTPPFTWILRGHGRVISWPGFSIVVSQGIRRPEEREADGEGPEGGTVRKHTEFYQLSSRSYMGMVHDTPNYNSNIKDHWSQVTITNITTKKFEILRSTKMWQRDTSEQKLLGKWCW